MFRLERTIDRDTDVIGLLLAELGQLHAELVEMQRSDLFVEVLRQDVDIVLIFIALGPQFDLRQRLISEAEAHHEAGKWEHVVSPRVEAAFLKLLEDPTTCPHGNPIPGSDYQTPEGTSALAEISIGNGFVIERIPEELEFQAGLLEFLEESNLIPGENGTVTAVSPDGTTTVDVKGRQIGIGAFASQRILVTVG